MNTAKKQFKVSAHKIILSQAEGDIDILYFLLDALSPDPQAPDGVPYFLMPVAEGYGAQWLQEVYGLAPDEVIHEIRWSWMLPKQERL